MLKGTPSSQLEWLADHVATFTAQCKAQRRWFDYLWFFRRNRIATRVCLSMLRKIPVLRSGAGREALRTSAGVCLLE